MLRVEKDSARGARLLTEVALAAGQPILRFDGAEVSARPSIYTVQIGPDAHVDGDALGELAFLNHSCAPTAAIDTEARVLVALHDLAPGDELTFFYPSTEWAMDHPFRCACGAPPCIGVVAGAKYLSADVLGRYFINPHIRALLVEAVSAPLVPMAAAV